MLKHSAILLTLALLGLVWAGAVVIASWRDRRKGSRFAREVWAVGGLGGLTGAFFWRPLFESGVTMPMGGGDLASFQYPMYVFSGQSFNLGDFPLWNPHLFAGMPYAADIQAGLFYPLNLLFFWLGHPIDYPKTEMLVILHYWLAASFTYACLRSLKVERWPAFIGGSIFAFSGFAVAHLGHLPMFETTTWFPLVLLAVNQTVRRKSIAWAVATGLVLAIAFLAGHFQLFVYNLYAALGFGAVLAWYLRPTPENNSQTAVTLVPTKRNWLARYVGGPARRYWLVQVGLLATTLVIVVGATLVQLWPFYELGNLSVRSGISYETSTQFGVWPVGLAELFLPNLFETNPTNYYGAWSNTEVLGYLGLFSYLLAAFGLLVGKQPKIYSWFVGGLILLGLLFSLSGFTILQGWLYQFVPALKLMRASGRFLMWVDFGGAIAAAWGVQALLNWLAEPYAMAAPTMARTLKWAWRGAGLALVGLLLIPLPLLYSTILNNPGNTNDLLLRGINGLVLAGILLGLSAILLRMILHRTLKPNAAAGLMLALIIFDLFSARANFNPTTQDVTAGFDHSPIANFLHQQDSQNLARIDVTGSSATQAWQPDTADIFGLDDVQGVFNPLQLARYDTLWNAVVKQGKNFRTTPAYALFNVGYVIARNKEDPPGLETLFKDTRPGINLNVDANQLTLGRAWIVHHAVSQPDEATLKSLLLADFKPAETVYLTNGKNLNNSLVATGSESVQVKSQSNNRLELAANLSSEGYLVLSQAYYPGWKVQIDGTNGTLENADYAFGAILLPPGQHSVKLEFAPTSFYLGLLISSLVWLIASIFLVFSLLRVWRPRKPRQVLAKKASEPVSRVCINFLHSYCIQGLHRFFVIVQKTDAQPLAMAL